MSAQITALATYAPERRVDNAYFEKIVDTNDEWILTRTGIRERRFSAPDETLSGMCVKAAQNLVNENPGLSLDGVDFIIVATTTADQVMPSMASQIQNTLGLPNVGCIDIMAACAGFVYGLILAKGMLTAGTHKKVLVFGAERLSAFTDMTDRTSCILFGDAAGVALVEPSAEPKILQTVTGTDGSLGKDLYLSQSATVVNGEEIKRDGKIHQNGRVVFKWAVRNVAENAGILLAKNNMTLDDLDYIILHSANMRIIEAVAHELNFPMEKMLTSIETFGNTSSASIPLAWDLAKKAGKIKKGQKILLLGFGGGLTFAGTVVIV